MSLFSVRRKINTAWSELPNGTLEMLDYNDTGVVGPYTFLYRWPWFKNVIGLTSYHELSPECWTLGLLYKGQQGHETAATFYLKNVKSLEVFTFVTLQSFTCEREPHAFLAALRFVYIQKNAGYYK